MTSRLALNAFDMTCVTHQAPGLWRHPENRADRYHSLDYWTDLARTLEDGGFDALFLADVLGVYDVYQGSAAPSLRDASQVPMGDPFLNVPAMAAVTRDLGFVVTAAATFAQPYQLARTFSSLDHLTQGRIGFNVVTSYLASAGRNLGHAGNIPHDERYTIAEEFLEVVYKLWEGSWEEDAVLRDRESGVFTDPRKVHPIGHRGRYFDVEGIHLAEPSRQRTPVIYQAGASPRGLDFAARHAEGVFINGVRPATTRRTVDDLRRRAAEQGRGPRDLQVSALMTVIVADSDAAAEAKHREYLSYASRDGALALFGGWSGLDLSTHPSDVALRYVDTDAVRSALSIFTKADPDRDWTPDDVAEYLALGGIGPVIVGSPATVADELERWADEADLDGINLAYAVTPGSFEEFAGLVVPELRARGRVEAPAPGSSLRERVSGGLRVKDTHPAASWREAYVGSPGVEPALPAGAR